MSDFVEIRGSTLCPICGHKSRCKLHREHGANLVTCFRVTDAEAPYKRLKLTEGVCAVFVREGSPADRPLESAPARRNGHAKTPDSRPVYHDEAAQRFSRQITTKQTDALACELGVSSDSLRLIGVGHTGQHPCFPERDDAGHVIGINQRRDPGQRPRHLVRAGDRRGLIVPDNLNLLPDPALIVEGPSDVAACLSMGLAAVGRPNNTGGGVYLSKLLRSRSVIVAGENDRKADGRWPGREGAERIAAELSAAWNTAVPWALPPDGIKDVREFLIHHAGEDPREVGRRFLAHLTRDAGALKQTAQLTTDVGNAARFAIRNRDRFHFCHGPAHWLVWDGRRWKPDDAGESVRCAKETAISIFDEAKAARDSALQKALASHAMRSQSRERITAMLALAQPEMAANAAGMDADPWLFNCTNGTIDLRTGELRPHDRSDLITKLAPVHYHPDATCPLWRSTLTRSFDGDESLISFVQRLEGMCLTGDVTEQVFSVYHGAGGNGKNIHLDTICGLMGDYACEAPPNLLTAGQHHEHPTEIADLMGRRLVIASETEEASHLKLQLVKRLTGNAMLKARFMRQNYFQFARTFKLVLVTNNKPVVSESGEAAWRRIRLIPFNVVIPPAERDPDLIDRLRDEWPGILAWLVRGCLDWQQHGLQDPEAVRVATAEYRNESDLIGQFMQECCDISPDKWVPSARLRAEYERWSAERGVRPLAGKAFTARLRDHGADDEKKQGVRGWAGVGMRGDG